MPLAFKKAVKREAKGRIGLVGPSGSGKTYTALQIATTMLSPGGRIALVDTERGSASKYADLFNFDVLEPESFAPESMSELVRIAEREGYQILIADSLSHFWMGKDGALEQVDRASKKNQGNSFSGWRDVTPKHNAMIDALLASKMHIIVTMRAKTEWVVEKDQKTGKSVPRKIGVQPVQRDGMEYEFDVTADLDLDNNLIVGKTRCPALHGKVFERDGKALAEIFTAWLSGAAPEVKPAAVVPTAAPAPPRPPGDIITETAQKAIFALMHEHDKSQADVKAIIKRHGFDRTADITQEKYAAICEEIKAKRETTA